MLVDTEHSFDPEWATSCGCNVGDLIIQHPMTGEEAVDAVQMGLSMGVDELLGIRSPLPSPLRRRLCNSRETRTSNQPD